MRLAEPVRRGARLKLGHDAPGAGSRNLSRPRRLAMSGAAPAAAL